MIPPLPTFGITPNDLVALAIVLLAIVSIAAPTSRASLFRREP